MRASFHFVFIASFFVCSAQRAFSQDTLFMANGTTISSKVLEVSTEEVKYKRSDNLEGPLFITKRAEINVIRYSNGISDTLNKPKPPVVVAPPDPNPPIYRKGIFYKQGYSRMKAKEMHRVIGKMNDPQIAYHVKKAKLAKGMEYVGFVAVPTFAFALGYTAVALITNIDGYGDMSFGPGLASGIVAAAALTTSITFKFSGKKHNDAALKIYNEKY
jgi:hypothetical protein